MNTNYQDQIAKEVVEIITPIKEKYEISDSLDPALIEIFQAAVDYAHNKVDEIMKDALVF